MSIDPTPYDVRCLVCARSDHLFAASFDLFPAYHDAIDQQAVMGCVDANQEHRVPDPGATCSLIGNECKPAYPSEDSIQALDRHRYQNQVLDHQRGR